MKNITEFRLLFLALTIGVVFTSCISNVEEQLENTVADDPAVESKVSFATAVKPIIDARCTSCHSASGGQFPDLTGYANVKAKSDRVKERVASRTMPNNGTLSQSQIDAIVNWVDEGALDN